jgi:HEPN domain-containing protein
LTTTHNPVDSVSAALSCRDKAHDRTIHFHCESLQRAEILRQNSPGRNTSPDFFRAFFGIKAANSREPGHRGSAHSQPDGRQRNFSGFSFRARVLFELSFDCLYTVNRKAKQTAVSAMNQEEKYSHWLDVAEYDLKTAEAMFAAGRWVYVAFMCQQAIEKLLKGLYVLYLDDNVPYIHSLGEIAARFEDRLPNPISEERQSLFDRLTAYYISGRYPKYKEKVSMGIDRNEAEDLLDKSKGTFSWLLTLKP